MFHFPGCAALDCSQGQMGLPILGFPFRDLSIKNFLLYELSAEHVPAVYAGGFPHSEISGSKVA